MDNAGNKDQTRKNNNNAVPEDADIVNIDKMDNVINDQGTSNVDRAIVPNKDRNNFSDSGKLENFENNISKIQSTVMSAISDHDTNERIVGAKCKFNPNNDNDDDGLSNKSVKLLGHNMDESGDQIYNDVVSNSDKLTCEGDNTEMQHENLTTNRQTSAKQSDINETINDSIESFEEKRGNGNGNCDYNLYEGEIEIFSIHQLPDDCLLLIFAHLSMYERLCARQVCSRWYHLLEDEIRRDPSSLVMRVSHQVELSMCQKPSDGFKFFPIRHQFTCAELAELERSNVLAKFVGHIVKLEFSMVFIGANALVSLVRHCPRLNNLIVHDCNLNRRPDELGQAVRLLQDRLLVLSCESNICLDAGSTLLMEAPNLQVLNLRRNFVQSHHLEQSTLFGNKTHTVRVSVFEPPLRFLERLIERCAFNLTHLELDSEKGVAQYTLFEPQPCLSRISRLSCLVELIISMNACAFISDLNNAAVAQLLRSCRHLEKLIICPRYRDTGHSLTGHLLELLIKWSPKLSYLKLTSLTELTAVRVAQLKNLKNLQVCYLETCSISWQYTAEEVQLMAAPIVSCPKLRKLSYSCMQPLRDRLFWESVLQHYTYTCEDARFRTLKFTRDRGDHIKLGNQQTNTWSF